MKAVQSKGIFASGQAKIGGDYQVPSGVTELAVEPGADCIDLIDELLVVRFFPNIERKVPIVDFRIVIEFKGKLHRRAELVAQRGANRREQPRNWTEPREVRLHLGSLGK